LELKQRDSYLETVYNCKSLLDRSEANNSMSEIEHIKLILSAAKALEQEIKVDVRSFAEVNRHLRDIKNTCYHAIGEQKMGSGPFDFKTSE
jgi:hypothetical protein